MQDKASIGTDGWTDRGTWTALRLARNMMELEQRLLMDRMSEEPVGYLTSMTGTSVSCLDAATPAITVEFTAKWLI